MLKLKDHMEIKIDCQRCREKHSVSTYTKTDKFLCPACHARNPDPRLRRRSSSEEDEKISRPLISDFVREKLKKILRKPGDNSSCRSSSSRSIPNSITYCAYDNPLASSAKKRAVLCGVSYKNWKYKLKGTINDVFNMKQLLIDVYAFEEKNMLVLTEEQLDNRLIPTKVNIENSLRWLVQDCKPGDSLVFYYSGHGSRQPDFEMDELDGFDETICPVDFLKEGMILDNDIYATIVKPLPVGVILHVIVDACHSGTILDLEHVYDREVVKWIDNRPPSGVRKQTSGGKAYSISACEDDQIGADTSAFDTRKMNGVLTFILIEIVRKNKSITYGQLLDEMQERIDQANQQGCFSNSGKLRKFFGPNFTQKPLLSASEQFDVYEKKFEL